MTPLSVIVITRNEERNIVACLDSVKWAEEIVVVDAESTDATAAMARQFTQKVFVEPWKNFSEAKEFAVTKSRHEWILWIDADERVTPELATEIQSLLNSMPSKAAYSIARRAFFLGRWMKHSGWYPGRVARLFRKGSASFSSVAVHEGLNVQGPVGELRNDLLHFTDPNLYHYMGKFNRYTTLASKDSFESGRRFRPVDLFVRPPWLFFKMYIVRLGFLDGVPGLLLAFLSSAYVFTKYAKLWEAWNSR
ncbi:MAG: glycosyltransferase family 2 protein [Bacteroidota bacterium]